MQTVTIPMEELAKILRLQLENGRAELTVTGSSMYPMLHHRRDTVTLEKPDRPLKKGDVILYQRPSGQYVLHRIVGLREAGFWCCGDNQWEKEAVEESQVLALVCRFRRLGKEHSTEDPGYQRSVRLWIAMMPIRKPVIAARRLAGRVKRKILKKPLKRC